MTAHQERWVSQKEAAELETRAGRACVQSSISRFLARNTDVPVRRGPSGAVQMVEYNALAAARAASLPVQDRQAAQPGRVEPAEFAPGARAPSRKRQIEDELLEMQLAEKKGQLVSRASVQSAVETAGLAFVQALDRRRRVLATRLAGVEDVREVELAMKAADRELLETLAGDLAAAADGLTVPDMRAARAGEYADAAPAFEQA